MILAMHHPGAAVVQAGSRSVDPGVPLVPQKSRRHVGHAGGIGVGVVGEGIEDRAGRIRQHQHVARGGGGLCDLMVDLPEQAMHFDPPNPFEQATLLAQEFERRATDMLPWWRPIGIETILVAAALPSGFDIGFARHMNPMASNRRAGTG